MEKIGLTVVLCLMTLSAPLLVTAKEKIPENVESIKEENTYHQSNNKEKQVKLDKSVKKLLDDEDIKIENESLIKMLNETKIKPSFFSIGYRGNIYLGHWPLNYESEKSNIKWDFQLVNTNEVENKSVENDEEIYYQQLEEKRVNGGLTAKVEKPDQIKQLILKEAKKSYSLPLSFQTVFGEDTKLSKTYEVPAGQKGELAAYVPALLEKGEVTFGEVYIELRGTKKKIVIQNVTKQEVGAFIPVKNYVTLQYLPKG